MNKERIKEEYLKGNLELEISESELDSLKELIDYNSGFFELSPFKKGATTRPCLVLSLVENTLFLEMVYVGSYVKPRLKAGAYKPITQRPSGSWNLWEGDRLD